MKTLRQKVKRDLITFWTKEMLCARVRSIEETDLEDLLSISFGI